MRSVTAIMALALLGLAAQPAAAASLQALTSTDAQLYAEAFTAAEQLM